MDEVIERIPASLEIRRLLAIASDALLKAAADLAENSPDVYLEADVRALGTDVWLLNGGDAGDCYCVNCGEEIGNGCTCPPKTND